MRTLLALTSALAMAAPLAAQSSRTSDSPSLVELAEKERQRRKRVESNTRVITNDELGYRSQPSWPGDPEPGDGEAPEATSSDGAEDTEEEKTPEAIRAEKQAELQAKLDEELQRMNRIREVMAQAQQQLADRSDLTFGTRRANLQKLIDDGEAELARSEEALERIAREARFAGVRLARPR